MTGLLWLVWLHAPTTGGSTPQVVRSVTGAAVVPAALDVWETRDGTVINFADNPIPADWLCPGSPPFNGTIPVTGVPVITDPPEILGNGDTVVLRDEAELPGIGDSDTVYVEAVALSLQAESWLPRTSPCIDFFRVEARLGRHAGQQPRGTMTLTRTSAGGGTFVASFDVLAEVAFYEVSTGELHGVLDDQVHIETDPPGEWTFALPPETGAPGPVVLDTNGDGVIDAGESAVSFPGAEGSCIGCSPDPQPGCATPPCVKPVPHPPHVVQYPPDPWDGGGTGDDGDSDGDSGSSGGDGGDCGRDSVEICECEEEPTLEVLSSTGPLRNAIESAVLEPIDPNCRLELNSRALASLGPNACSQGRLRVVENGVPKDFRVVSREPCVLALEVFEGHSGRLFRPRE